MKKTRIFGVVFALLFLIFGICACKPTSTYSIMLDTEKSFTLQVGDEVDFTEYFIVSDGRGNPVPVTRDMLDLGEVDTSKPGTFTVTLTIGDSRLTAKFFVVGKSKPDLGDVLRQYADPADWNFAVTVTMTYDVGDSDTEYYEYLGYDVLNTYTVDIKYTDYVGYDEASDTFWYYSDNGDGTYGKYDEFSQEYEEYYAYSRMFDLTVLGDYTYTFDNDRYVAERPSAAGNAVLGEYDAYEWVRFEIVIEDGRIASIFGEMDNGYTERYEFSKYGSVNFTLPDADEGGGSGDGGDGADTMEQQTYDRETFDAENLQDKLADAEGAIGLPATGTYSALVIPVRFAGSSTISSTRLAQLNTAFNGTSEETGWESVRTYYQKASYGKLNLSFDIQPAYVAQHSASYYENSGSGSSLGSHADGRKRVSIDIGQSQVPGEELILKEALAYYESRLDLTKYDTNGDGVIDAVYLIYDTPVEYSDDSFYWAFVTFYTGGTTYDGKGAYYYLFAGFDFMDENTERCTTPYYDTVYPGLKVNAKTYIHETGHLLGLDDYYDYDEKTGSNEGLGYADMMDYNEGDQNVYSKTMLGWLTPTIVNATETVTIRSSAAAGDAILIPLDFNNSYFCEYLLIDLYSATGLNEFQSKQDETVLYDGADFGVRIYHVSSSADRPFQNEFGSFTDYDNSSSKYALIKLVEADGERRFASTNGFAAESDLWQTGDRLSRVFPAYARNDGKRVNFDITIGSVTASSATVTVTFY